ncbi:hypothetical protein BV378_12205 [Nostoc sp. RF31YmG]|jgi:hypothetical protein|nr:hypothetical protein BV378_12205 [Nostoc sp. RF31YmG]
MIALTQHITQVPTTVNRPEIELLLCCARTHIAPSTAEQIRALLQQDIDWEYLIQIAARNQVMLLLYWSLNTTCPDAFPKAILSQQRNLYYTNAQRNLFQTAELLKLLNLFEAHNILTIPFKGPVLAASAYGNLALRQFGDLDMLVQEQDIPKATDLLISQGYKLPPDLVEVQQRPYLQFDNFRESVQYRKSYDFVHPDQKVVVELHWLLSQKYFPFPVDFEQLWENRESVSLVGTTVSHFSPEDSLLHLCMHGAKDAWVRMKGICDVAQLIQSHPTIKWEQVMKQSRILGSERMLLLGLFLAHGLLGTTLPEEVLLKIHSNTLVKSLYLQVCEWLFERQPSKFEVYILHLKVREHLADKLRYFLYLTITPNEKEWALLPLPKFLSFLYYLLRPLRLIAENGFGTLKHFLRIEEITASKRIN